MAHEESRTPMLDEWIAEIGEDGVLTVIEDAKRQIGEGTVAGFHDRDSFLEFLEELRRGQET